jgi:hypothetical protein
MDIQRYSVARYKRTHFSIRKIFITRVSRFSDIFLCTPNTLLMAVESGANQKRYGTCHGLYWQLPENQNDHPTFAVRQFGLHHF